MNLKTAAAGLVSSVALAAGATLVGVAPAEAGREEHPLHQPRSPDRQRELHRDRHAQHADQAQGRPPARLGGPVEERRHRHDVVVRSVPVSSHTAGRPRVRIVAPQDHDRRKTYPQITVLTKTVDVVIQTAVVTVSKTSPQVGEVVQIVGRFTPTRKGRAVRAYVRANGTSYGLGFVAELDGPGFWTSRPRRPMSASRAVLRAGDGVQRRRRALLQRVDVTAIP